MGLTVPQFWDLSANSFLQMKEIQYTNSTNPINILRNLGDNDTDFMYNLEE